MTRRANRGRAWEVKLDHQHRAYREDRQAVVFHAHPEIRGGVRQKAPPDYFGVVGGGQGVLFDAKEHQGSRWPFSKLARHQALALESWQDRGGLAGIALRLGSETFWVDWRALGPHWWLWHEKNTRAAASINVEMLRLIAKDMNGGADWLAVAL